MQDHLEEIKPPRARKALEEHFGAAVAAKELTTIRRNLALELELGPHEGTYDRDRVLELLPRDGVQLARRRACRSPGTSSEAEAGRRRRNRRSNTTRITVDDEEKLDGAGGRAPHRGSRSRSMWRAMRSTRSAPTSSGSPSPPAPDRSYYVPVAHDEGRAVAARRGSARCSGRSWPTRQLPKYAHHGKYDLLVLDNAGIELRGVTFDTMLAAYVLGESTVGLKDLAFTKLGIEMTPIEELIGRGKAQTTMDEVAIARDDRLRRGRCPRHLPAGRAVRGAAEGARTGKVFETIEMPLVPVLADMERTGIALDVDYLKNLSGRITEVINQREREIHRLADHEFNINSTQQLAKVLFEDLGLTGRKRTQKGYSTNVDVLEELRDKHPIVEAILEYRQLGKLKSTYVDSLPLMVNPQDGADPYLVQPDDRLDRATQFGQPEPAKYPDPHRDRARGAPRVHRRQSLVAPPLPRRGVGAGRGRLLAGGVAPAGPPQRRREPDRGLPARRGYPPAHGGAGQRHPAGAGDERPAPDRQERQLRDHLRPQRLRPLARHGDAGGAGRRVHQGLLRAVSEGAGAISKAAANTRARLATSPRSSGGGAISPTSTRPTG